ncbi:MAG: head GIN domain-containing protein [Chakrabartia sp.]
MRFLIPLTLIVLSGCGQASADAAGQSAGEARFDVSNFDGVALLGPDNVRVLPGASFSVRATGPKAVLDTLVIHVDHGILKVDRKRPSGWLSVSEKQKGKAEVIVTMPLIRSAALSGAGALTIAAPTAPDQFAANLSGAGDLTVQDAASKRVAAHLSGSGDIVLRGATDMLAADLSGSGDINASGLPVRLADLRLSGVGDIRAQVHERAQGSLSGVGDIEVRGGAQCALRKSGVGAVNCAP